VAGGSPMTVLRRTPRSVLRQLSQGPAVLVERDGALVSCSLGNNGDPARVDPLPDARDAVARLPEAGFRLGVVSSQFGIGRGLAWTRPGAVNCRIEEFVGKMDSWRGCSHTQLNRSRCRKPVDLIVEAAADLGVPADQVVLVADIGTDILAAPAGGRGHSRPFAAHPDGRDAAFAFDRAESFSGG